jgi:hypothetical protein
MVAMCRRDHHPNSVDAPIATRGVDLHLILTQVLLQILIRLVRLIIAH